MIILNFDWTIFNWSALAAFFSAVAAAGSLIIAVLQFRHLKAKETPTLSLSSNFETLALNFNSNEVEFENVVNKNHFELQNLSSLQINLIEIEFSDNVTQSKKEFFQNVDENPAFITLGFPMQPVIRNFQPYYIDNKKINYIKPDEITELKLPAFIFTEFIHASFKMESGQVVNFTNSFKLKIRYYDKITSKLKEKTQIIPYKMEFQGARALIHFHFDPVVIKLD